MNQTFRTRIIAGALALGLGVGGAVPLHARMDGCWRCVSVTIPDPTGGYFLDDVCLVGLGSAQNCVEFFPGYPGGGCWEINAGSCT